MLNFPPEIFVEHQSQRNYTFNVISGSFKVRDRIHIQTSRSPAGKSADTVVYGTTMPAPPLYGWNKRPVHIVSSGAAAAAAASEEGPGAVRMSSRLRGAARAGALAVLEECAGALAVYRRTLGGRRPRVDMPPPEVMYVAAPADSPAEHTRVPEIRGSRPVPRLDFRADVG